MMRTEKEKVYWKLVRQLNYGEISPNQFDYMLNIRNIWPEDARQYYQYKLINWIFGMTFFCATLYYFLISDYGVIK